MTGQRIHRYQWDEMSMSDAALNQVHQLAEQQGQPLVSSNFRYERRPGESLDPADDEQDYEEEIVQEVAAEAADDASMDEDEQNPHNEEQQQDDDEVEVLSQAPNDEDN